MNFKEIPKKYRPIPFWSWNEKLDVKETAEQVHKMDDVGIGGFFMHARGGLQTEYMSDEWFSNVESAIKTAEETGMGAWAYDENGWPSGFGNGYVNGLGVEYQQKYLRMSKDEPKENIIAKCGEHWFYFDVNPFYVDVLDKKVIAEFIEYAYKPYYEKYGNRIEGFFTDEPQSSRNGIPWSFVFEGEYQKRYGENINEHLEELFFNIGDYKNTRVKFWKMVTDLFSESFMKQIYDKCNEWGLRLTGHLVLEETLVSQLTSNGACMPHYEYMHIPGMDWLGRNIRKCLIHIQLSSVCDQLGIKQVLSETFALCGHNVNFAELKGIYEWQMVHGINLLCQHLEGYSIRGIRKRDYPPAMYSQQPWWSEYEAFVDAMSREGMILTEGKKYADVLVIHPQTTAWIMYEGNRRKGEFCCGEKLAKLEKDFMTVIDTLEKKHIMYHLGDETIMERHAKVENGKIVIGEQSYSYVIDSVCEMLLPNTESLIDEFKAQGGKVIKADEIPYNFVCDNDEITYVKRVNDEYTVHYFVNTSKDRKKANINVDGKKLDIYTGDLVSFEKNYEFEPWGSLMVIEGEESSKTVKNPDIIKLNGEFDVSKSMQNAITLDTCDYYFDGVLQEKNGYVLNICERANALEKAVKIHQDYHVKMNYMPKEMYLVCETPEKFEIKVNGKVVEKVDGGYYIDKSFRKIDISGYIQMGENTISFECDFKQSDKFYENRRNAFVFESEKNKLSYDMEIEAIYLLGDFSVRTDGDWEYLDKNAVRYSGNFEIDKPKNKINIKNIEQQGYPFFSGEMTLEGEIEIEGENPVLEIDWKGINALRVKIGEKERVMLTDDRLSLAEFGVKGKTKIKITIINNLRNILGPHHLEEGEIYGVGPGNFFKEKCIWQSNPDGWNDGYCFVEMSV